MLAFASCLLQEGVSQVWGCAVPCSDGESRTLSSMWTVKQEGFIQTVLLVEDWNRGCVWGGGPEHCAKEVAELMQETLNFVGGIKGRKRKGPRWFFWEEHVWEIDNRMKRAGYMATGDWWVLLSGPVHPVVSINSISHPLPGRGDSILCV